MVYRGEGRNLKSEFRGGGRGGPVRASGFSGTLAPAAVQHRGERRSGDRRSMGGKLREQAPLDSTRNGAGKRVAVEGGSRWMAMEPEVPGRGTTTLPCR